MHMNHLESGTNNFVLTKSVRFGDLDLGLKKAALVFITPPSIHLILKKMSPIFITL